MKTPILLRTIEPIALNTAHLAANSTSLPEFTRLPASGERCSLTSLSRGALNALILGSNPPVKSVCLRRKGATRGIRLIVTSSLLEWLYSNLDGPAERTAGNEAERKAAN